MNASSFPLTPSQREYLASFQNSLPCLSAEQSDIPAWQGLIEDILSSHPFSIYLSPKLVQQAQGIQELFNQPKITGERINTFALKLLRSEMRTLLTDKLKKLKTFRASNELLKKIEPYQQEAFLKEICLKAQELTAIGLPRKAVLTEALAYAISRSMIDPENIDDCEGLKRYICPIQSVITLSDAVYIKQRVSRGEPLEHYKEEAIKQWLSKNATEPMGRIPTSTKDICKAPNAPYEAREIILNYLYPGVKQGQGIPSLSSFNPSDSLFFSALLGKVIIENFADHVKNTSKALDHEDVRIWQALAIELFTPFLEEMNFNDLLDFDWSTLNKKREGFSREEEYTSRIECLLEPRELFPSLTFDEWKEKICFMGEFLKDEMSKERPSHSPSLNIANLRVALTQKMGKYIAFIQEIEALEISRFQRGKYRSRGLELSLKSSEAASFTQEGEVGGKRLREVSASSVQGRKTFSTLEDLLESAQEEERQAAAKKLKQDSELRDGQMDCLNRFF